MPATDVTNPLGVVEAAKRTLNKNVLEVAEVLAEMNDFINDSPWIESNQQFSHKHVRRLALPKGTYRRFNRGVPTEASQTVDIVEDIGMLSTYSDLDKDLVEGNNNPKQFRWQEDKGFLEGLNQTFADTFVYGNRATDPEKINGVMTRYNSLSNGNVWTAGGDGSDLTSILIMQWGLDKVFFVYPRGSATVGIKVLDKGQVTLEDENGDKFEGYRTFFESKHGLVIRDERCVQRICNIETSGDTNIFDPKILVRAINHMPMKAKGAVIYVNETMKSQMDNDAMDKTNVYYTSREVYGQSVTFFRGIPVHRCDAILDTEDEVT
jgi:hypothetical protein